MSTHERTSVAGVKTANQTFREDLCLAVREWQMDQADIDEISLRAEYWDGIYRLALFGNATIEQVDQLSEFLARRFIESDATIRLNLGEVWLIHQGERRKD